MVNKAGFFDRDGTLNVDVHYLYRRQDFRWTEGAVEAIKYCNDRDYKVIVITNQSGVARGYYTEDDVCSLHAWMNRELVQQDAHIDAFYYCPHHPAGRVAKYAIECNCRKPKTKLVDEACQTFAIDRSQSFFVGDKASDMECAHNAGIPGFCFCEGSLLEFIKKRIKGLR